MLAHKLPSRLEWLKFALQLGDSDHSRNKLDVLLLENIFVLSLRVFCDEAYGCYAWIDDRMSEGTKLSGLIVSQGVHRNYRESLIHTFDEV